MKTPLTLQAWYGKAMCPFPGFSNPALQLALPLPASLHQFYDWHLENSGKLQRVCAWRHTGALNLRASAAASLSTQAINLMIPEQPSDPFTERPTTASYRKAKERDTPSQGCFLFYYTLTSNWVHYSFLGWRDGLEVKNFCSCRRPRFHPLQPRQVAHNCNSNTRRFDVSDLCRHPNSHTHTCPHRHLLILLKIK